MKRGKRVDPWYPFFIDKWLLGSTRLELIINKDWVDRWPQLVPLVPEWILAVPCWDLRGIFADLLTLSKKDGGYIRANERMGYPHAMLAGQLCVPIELLELTIKICLHKDIGKMSEPIRGVYYIESTDAYSFTDRYKRMVESAADKALPFTPTDECSGKAEGPSAKAETIGKDRIGKDIGSKRTFGPPDPRVTKVGHVTKVTDSTSMSDKEIEEQFEKFWTSWPREGKHAKEESRKKFRAICKRGRMMELSDACRGYAEFLAYQKDDKNFDQRPMYAKTFLNGRWEEYIGFKKKPKL